MIRANAATALSINDVVGWILGSFKSVAEVRAAMAAVTVWGEFTHEIQQVLPGHLIVHDSDGRSILFEWTDGQTRIYTGNQYTGGASPTSWC
jgi:choloylglycine hydrolase